MEHNGRKPSILQSVVGLLQDQLDLFSLELGFEKRQVRRRALALVAIGIFGLLSAALFQVAIVLWLAKEAPNIAGVCGLLGLLYGVIAGGIFWGLGRRDPRAGKPFEGSRRQLDENLKWIQTLFS